MVEVGEKTAVIALGSNMDPERNLAAGIRALSQWLRITEASSVYRTSPWGVLDQPDFLNAVVVGETDLQPEELLDSLLSIESGTGRVRTIANGPRTLDLDILFHGTRAMDSARLILPHPRLHERGFVLRPLCDVLPDFVHPSLARSPREYLACLGVEGIEPSGFTLPV